MARMLELVVSSTAICLLFVGLLGLFGPVAGLPELAVLLLLLVLTLSVNAKAVGRRHAPSID